MHKKVIQMLIKNLKFSFLKYNDWITKKLLDKKFTCINEKAWEKLW
jgi:hypothetical protein